MATCATRLASIISAFMIIIGMNGLFLLFMLLQLLGNVQIASRESSEFLVSHLSGKFCHFFYQSKKACYMQQEHSGTDKNLFRDCEI
jgi:hypothetical protein